MTVFGPPCWTTAGRRKTPGKACRLHDFDTPFETPDRKILKGLK
jgi:hypothetical protein